MAGPPDQFRRACCLWHENDCKHVTVVHNVHFHMAIPIIEAIRLSQGIMLNVRMGAVDVDMNNVPNRKTPLTVLTAGVIATSNSRHSTPNCT